MTLSTKSLEERLTPSSKQVPLIELLTEMGRAVQNSDGGYIVILKFPFVMKMHTRSLPGVTGTELKGQ